MLCAVLVVAAGCSQAQETVGVAAGGSPEPTVAASADTAASPTDASSPQPEGRPVLGVPDLQAGNRSPKLELLTKRSRELADSRISLAYAGAGLSRDLPHLQDFVEDITHLGAKRINSSLYEIEPPIDWELDEHHIPAEFDRFVDALADQGVAFDYVLHFWDKAGHARGEPLSTPRFQDPQQIADYVDYARFIARHFEGRVANYTIWSEPDNCGQEGGIKCVRPDDYIELARQVIPAIRAEDPQATVAIAPVVLFFERDFLPAVLSSDVAAMFDVIQWHGQYTVTPDDPFYAEHGYYEQYPQIVDDIRQLAEANGFDGEYWSTEMGWCSQQEQPPCENPDHPWGAVATNRIAAKYYARGVVMHLGMDIAAGISPEERPWIGATKRYLATVMAGATPTDRQVDIQADGISDPIRSFAFALPDGGQLLAVWADRPAVDDDPGQSATITLPGTTASRAVGIDLVDGFEQELTDTRGGDLVIRDLLIRDHPTIVRIEP